MNQLNGSFFLIHQSKLPRILRVHNNGTATFPQTFSERVIFALTIARSVSPILIKSESWVSKLNHYYSIGYCQYKCVSSIIYKLTKLVKLNKMHIYVTNFVKNKNSSFMDSKIIECHIIITIYSFESILSWWYENETQNICLLKV